jgi:hypothetical protein
MAALSLTVSDSRKALREAVLTSISYSRLARSTVAASARDTLTEAVNDEKATLWASRKD